MPADYFDYIAAQGIVLDLEQRQAIIWEQAQCLAQSVGGKLDDDPDLLAEVTNLVERPTAMLGSFEERYIQNLPPEVLIGVMRKHQRYFPVIDAQGNLLPHFVFVRNGDERYQEVVVDGNLQVIHARFADAEFFIQEDKQKKLEEFIPKLSQLIFQKDLGSMLDKTRRIQQLVKTIGQRLSLSEAEQIIVDRTAELCKADLATAMVVEMTELQGVMGRYYAKLSGEPEEVAEGIFEHYLPRNAEDRLPEGKPGMLVGIADRLDSIAGLFAVGLAPSGSKDPFALRRAALGLVQLLIGKGLEFDLDWGLNQAGKLLPVNFSENDKQSAFEFITGRLRGLMLEQGYRYDVVDAVLHRQAVNPAKAQGYIDTLSKWVARPDWMFILPAYSRCVRITRDLDQKFSIQEKLFVEPAEKELFATLLKAQRTLAGSEDLNAALEQLEIMVPVINTFFDSVLVMAEDTATRQNRLGLLQEIVALLSDKVNLSALEGF